MKLRRNIIFSALAFFMGYLARITWSVTSPYSSLRPTVAEDSLIFTLFFLGYVIVQIPAGILADMKSAKLITSLVLLPLSLSLFLSGMANNIELEYIASLIMGLSAGWIYPATLKVISETYKGRELAIAMGYYSLAWPLSITIAGLAIPYLTINLGWRWPYYILAALGIVGAIGTLTVSYPSNNLKGKSGFIIKFNRDVTILSFSGFLFFSSYWIITLYSYKYFLLIFNNPYLAGISYSLLALTGIPSTLISGRFINRLGVKRTLMVFELAYGILIVGIAFLHEPLVVFVIASLMGFIRFVITPANSTAVSLVGGNKSGSVAGTVNLFWQSSGISSPVLASIILGYSNYFVLWLFSALLVIGSAIGYISLKIKN
ncbi:MFS transporter [Metallosphaera tengchongensis]|uniref:MFS transporter n=1 Tax=Metallosphaera tengchongensis TaxID=1532350 RepID=A0A6N0NWP4_9CREN|nr:MFS transporter [Metallosphaera tengchongensis]QKQ99767.1 MFS transporter [Metallosphaera tengchongensis]